MSTVISPTHHPIAHDPDEYLPESGYKPIAETDVHVDQMAYVFNALREHFRDHPGVYVTGNILLLYLEEDGIRQSVAPDVFVVCDVEKKARRCYDVQVEGKVPDVVIEITSTATKMEDLHTKRIIYSGLGVKEYFIIDSDSEALRGFHLENREYVPLVGTRLHSEVLGLDFAIDSGRLRLYDRITGEHLRTYQESEAERRTEAAARQAAEAKAAAIEAENLRLREELAKYQKKDS
jgi:Uma2 family endonuclease